MSERAITPTEEQQAIINHAAGALLVTASAGTGKTATLTERCLSLVRGGASIDRMLIVTFTISAADELRARISQALRSARRATDDPAAREMLRRQEGLVEIAQIGTIDAWCGRVLRDNFERAGIDPNWRIMPPEEATVVRRETIDDVMAWVLSADDPLAEAGRDWVAALRRPLATPLAANVLGLNYFRERLARPEVWLAEARRTATQATPALVAEEQARLTAFALGELAPVIAALAVMRRENASDAWWFDSAIGHLEAAQSLLKNGATLYQAISAWDQVSKPRRNASPAIHFAYSAIDKRIIKRLLGTKIGKTLRFASLLARRRLTLIDLEARFEAQLAQTKKGLAAYEFGDVLRMTLRMLADYRGGEARPAPSDLARRIAVQFDHILIDEYQDTNPVQHELFRLVSRGGANLCMVGDVKQSIFGFRAAEPAQFSAVRADIEQGTLAGCVRPLTDSFRSHDRLVRAINTMFAPLFDLAFGGVNYDETQALRAMRVEIPNPTLDGDPRLELLLVEEIKKRDRAPAEGQSDDDDADASCVELQGRLIAAEIHALRERGVMVPDREGGLRPLAWRDIVVLSRVAQNVAAPLAAAMRDCGVPAIASGRESLFESIEVMDVRNVLALLVSGRREKELLAYLRSPLVELDTRKLIEIRSIRPRGSFADAVSTYVEDGADGSLRAQLSAALKRVDAWRQLCRTADVPTVVRAIIRDGGIEEFALGRPSGPYRAAVLRAFEALADQCAAAGQGMAEFVEFVDAMESEKKPPSATGVVADDAVRIMTIHVAKGLEFPIVFLAESGREFHPITAKGPLAHAEHGLGLRIQDATERITAQNAACYAAKRATEERERQEDLRLLYVAATRAREKLYIVGAIERKRFDEARVLYQSAASAPSLLARQQTGSMLGWVLMTGFSPKMTVGMPPLSRGAQLLKEQEVLERAAARQSAGGAPVAAESAALTPEDERWVHVARARLTARIDESLARRPAALSVSVVKQSARPAAAKKTEHAVRLKTPVTLARSAAPADDGLAFGSATHRFLEHMRPTCLKSAAEIEAEARRLVGRGVLSAEDAGLVRPEDVAWFGATSEGGLLIQHADALLRETPFVLTDPRRPHDAPLLRGVIDCLVPTPDGLTLIDYKTDRIPNEETWQARVAAYSIQARLYAIAAQRLLDRPVRRAVIVFLSVRRCHEVDPGSFSAIGDVFDQAGLREILATIAPAVEPADGAPVE